MSDSDDEVRIETLKDIQIGDDESVGVVNGERANMAGTFPAIPIPTALPTPGVQAPAPEPVRSATPEATPPAIAPAATVPKITIPTFNIEVSPPVVPPMPAQTQPAPVPKAPTPSVPTPVPAAAQVQVRVAPPLPQSPPPTPAAPPAPAAEPAAEAKSAADFNIFAEKTQVHIPSTTQSSVKAMPSTDHHPSSKVATFDDKTVVRSGTVSTNSRIKIPKSPPSTSRERFVSEPARPAKASRDISYQTTENDLDGDEPKSRLRLRAPQIFSKIEFNRKTISIGLGTIAVAMISYHLFFSSPDTQTKAVTASHKTATKREISSKAVAVPAVPIITQPQGAIVHQSTQEFFARFHATMQKNQN